MRAFVADVMEHDLSVIDDAIASGYLVRDPEPEVDEVAERIVEDVVADVAVDAAEAPAACDP